MSYFSRLDGERGHATAVRQVSRVCARFVGAIVALVSMSAVAGPRIISWFGNTQAWNERLNVTELRLGCSSAPQACMRALDAAARAQGIEAATLAINTDPDKIADYVAQYVALGRTEPRLRGIGMDDFVSALYHWKSARGDAAVAGLLQKVVENMRGAGSDLTLGITLYEDQVASPLLSEPFMSATVREGIGSVSLYVHYRTNGAGYEEYARQVRKLFPRVSLVAGVYPYDRRDYLPCSQRSKTQCSADQERELFQQTLTVQAQLLKSGVIDAMEFYPGNFGTEEQWQGWSNAKLCLPQRTRECIETTRQMHDATARILKAAGLLEAAGRQ